MARLKSAPVPERPERDYPPQLATKLLPFWQNLGAVVGVFSKYVTDDERESPIFAQRPDALYRRILNRWALDNGFESTRNTGRADFTALRAAGVIDSSERAHPV